MAGTGLFLLYKKPVSLAFMDGYLQNELKEILPEHQLSYGVPFLVWDGIGSGLALNLNNVFIENADGKKIQNLGAL